MKRLYGLSVLVALVAVASCGDSQDVFSQLREEIRANGFDYTVGPNSATDRNLEDLCGLVEPPNWWEGAPVLASGPSKRLALPSAYDARDDGLVSGVRDQGSCGSCWAFSSIATLESALLAGSATSVDESEQYMVSCNTRGWGCNGGWWAFDELMRLSSNKESCYRYTASDSGCKCDCNVSAQLNSWAYVLNDSSVPSVDQIKQAIFDHGPVSAAVYVDSAFQSYTGGIFRRNASGQVNHGIQLVGWDDNGQYWILKNSWGSGWGERGFMRIGWGSNSVGYAAAAVTGVTAGDWPPDSDCKPEDGQCNSSLNVPPSALSTIERYVELQDDAQLKQLANAVRNNSAEFAQLLRDNPTVETLVHRALWTNLDALEEYVEKGQTSKQLDLSDLRTAVEFANQAAVKNVQLRKALPKFEVKFVELHGRQLK